MLGRRSDLHALIRIGDPVQLVHGRTLNQQLGPIHPLHLKPLDNTCGPKPKVSDSLLLAKVSTAAVDDADLTSSL